MTDQCALDTNGNLKSLSKINFYHDVDDDAPMAGPKAAPKPNVQEPLGHGQRAGKAGQMRDALEAEKVDEFGVSIKPVASKPRCRRKKSKKASRKEGTGLNLDDDDAEDSNFETDDGDSSSRNSEDSDSAVPNSELAEIMPSKMAADSKRKSAPHSNNSHDNGSEAQPSSSTRKSRKAGGKRNPIYYFYEEVTHGAPHAA
ncbi:uncharacterized protein ARMOST_15518 [Armillaria ostoyae]|uniref:Uncharacterized protein n=1 Tax=Armillaria ostoyae TaxID=47428 RepID=A0A284RTK0_ARMOS|nr:uncharacterized protein ARMOST_15518 [Armillaria ostoyae]